LLRERVKAATLLPFSLFGKKLFMYFVFKKNKKK